MDKRDHYGPDFRYRVFWRQSVGNGPDWHHQEVSHNYFVVNNTKTFTPFEIKVQAVNNLGSGPESQPRIGHSGEDSEWNGLKYIRIWGTLSGNHCILMRTLLLSLRQSWKQQP